MPLSKPPLLLLPGTLCDCRLFSPLLDRLPPWPSVLARMDEARSAPALAGRILEGAPERFIALGFSLGGIVALEMAAQAPERVRGLILVDTTPRPDPESNAAVRRAAVAKAREMGIDGYIEDAWDKLVAPVNARDAALRQTILGMARRGGVALLDSQSEVAIHRADSRPRLARISAPTLVLAGAHEQVCPLEAQRELACGISGAQFRAIPDAGHFAPLENPDAVAEHIRNWLAAHFEEEPR